MKNIIYTCASVFFLLLSANVYSQAEKIELLQEGRKTSLRGLSVVTDNIVWVSGSNGTVGKSLDGGKTWEWITVTGFEKRDFRDIEAFDKNTAIIIGVAEPAIILKTKDGGKNWKLVFTDTTKDVFLDAMDFSGKKGFVIGDPINQHLYVVKTNDWGEHWTKVKPTPQNRLFAANEAFFASSGSNIVAGKKGFANRILFVSGGTASRLFIMPKLKNDVLVKETPLMMGGASRGANAMALSPSEKMGMIVGGDFSADSIRESNSARLIVQNGYVAMQVPETTPNGYKSSVAYITEKQLIACGTSGIDISKDGGMNWQLISKESFHVVQRAKKGTAVFLAGGKGRIAKLQ